MTPTSLFSSDSKRRIFLIFLGIMVLFAQKVAAQACSGIAGKAFSDYNYNGLNDDTGSVGVGGIEVKLFGGSGQVGSTTTAADGSYAFASALNAANYRVEFKIPTALNAYKFTANGLSNNIATQFVTAPNCTVNAAVAIPADYCQANPFLIAPIYVNGDPLNTAGSAKDSITLIATPYNVPSGNDYAQQKKLLTTAQIGSTWGVAFQRNRKIIVSTASLRRHVGFGPQGTGGIYFTDFSNPMVPSVLGSFSLTTAGTDPRVTDGVALPSDPTLPSNDVTAYSRVGKMSLGGATISDDDKTLYTINLATNELVKIDITALNADGTTLPTAANVTTVALPTPCGATGVFRPWAVKYWHGKLYIGGVCSAETSKLAADLSASIYCYDGTSFTLIKSFPLDYQRGSVKSNSPTFNKWLPWEDNYNVMLQNGQTDFLYPQPILSDIEFDTDGSMILGFTDRMGSQSGFKNYVPLAGFTFVLANGVTGGDIVRLCLRSGVYQVENTPAAGCSTTGGATDGEGPNGGEYYWSDFWTYDFLSQNTPPTAFPFPFHSEIAQGGLAMIAGRGQVVSTVYDPFSEAQTGGFTWFDNATGKRPRSYEAFTSTNATFQNRGYAGESNGLGDVQPACDPAPICVGNRVWADCNGNGVQEPSEKGIEGVTVTLLTANCTTPLTATTDVNGKYQFCGLSPNTTYYLTYGAAGSFNLGTQKLTVGGIPYVVSPLDLGIGTNPDENDSDASAPNASGVACENTLPFIKFTTGMAGFTNNSYDLGLVAPTLTTFNATATATTCSGEMDGTIKVTAVFAPVSPIEYSKDGGATWQASDMFTGLLPTTYNLKIRFAGATAASSCSADTLSATVLAGAKIAAPTTTADSLCQYDINSKKGGLTAVCSTCPVGFAPKITWWTAATGGVKMGEGSPFNPTNYNVPNRIDGSVAGTTVVYAQCECGANCVSDRTATNFVVTGRPLPTITGELSPCANSVVTYTTPSVLGSSWTWTLPSGGGTIVSTNLNSVTIRWNNVSSGGRFSLRVLEVNSLGCAQATTVSINLSSINMACIGTVNISLDYNCQYLLMVRSLLLGNSSNTDGFRLQIFSPSGQQLHNGFGSVTLDGRLNNLIGKRLQYLITEPCTGNACGGYLNLEDKSAPKLTSPDNITMSCVQLGDINIVPAISGVPTIQDCSGTFMTYVDLNRKTDCSTPFTALPNDLAAIYAAPFPTTGDVIEVILRAFKVKDFYNNASTCYQYIFVRRSNLMNVVAPRDNYEVACANYNGVISPTVSGVPVLDVDGDTTTVYDRLPITQYSCRLSASYADRILETCGGGKKIIRTWTVLDDCAGASKNLVQTLFVVDKTTPSVSAAIKQFYVVNTNLIGIDSTVNFSSEGIQDVYTVGNSYNCGGKTRIYLTGKDNGCVKSALTFSANDSRFRVVAGYPQYNAATFETTTAYDVEFSALGNYDVKFTAVNACQTAQISKSFRIKVCDNIAPNSVCRGTLQVALTTAGTARIQAEAFNASSTDNCGIERIEVRRLRVCGTTNTDFGDYVDFTCCDVLDTIMVALRVWDGSGNYSDCMTNVTVVDKIRPTCIAPANIVITCQELRFRRPSDFGQAAFWDNCTIKDTIYTESESFDNCKVGSFYRKWVISDRQGFKDSCHQTIRVTGKSDFTVDFPDDIDANCFAVIPTKEQAREALLHNLPNQDGHIINNGCGVIMVEVTDDTLTGVAGACYKILRKYYVIDFCKAGAIRTNTADFGGCFGQPLCGDVHGNANWANVNQSAFTVLDRPNCTNAKERLFRDADDLGGVPGALNAFSDGVICFTQVIQVTDHTPPVILPFPSDTTIRSSSTDCVDNIRMTINAVDKCVGDSITQDLDLVYYSWAITDELTNQVVKTGTGKNAFIENVPFAKTYRIGWLVSDRCGNTAIATQTVRLTDTKAPSLICRNINAELARRVNGSWVTVILSDLLMSTEDNCTPTAFLNSRSTMERASNSTNTYPSVINNSIVFDCADANIQVPIRIWTKDSANNANFCEVRVNVQDNLNACAPTVAASINGSVRDDSGNAVVNVTVGANANGSLISSATTTIQGNYSLTSGIAIGNNYTLKADKRDAPLNGVSTLDIALISKHILEIQPLATPYRIIAGDVNRDGELSGLDILQLRRLILRVVPEFVGGKSWRFVDKAFTFNDPMNPLDEDFPESVGLTNTALVSQANFIGIKIGDVNGNAYTGSAIAGATVRGANKALTFEADDVQMEANNDYTVTIRSSDFNAQGFQFTLNCAEGVEIVKVLNGNLPEMSESNFGHFKNALTMSWNGNFSGKSAEILTIIVRAKSNIALHDALTIGSNLTTAEGFDNKGEMLDLKLAFKGQNTEGSSFALYQNEPNPFYEVTKIAFHLPTDSKAKLVISDAAGRVLKTIEGNYLKGYNEVKISKTELNTSGIVFYRLETPTHTATKKMIVLN